MDNIFILIVIASLIIAFYIYLIAKKAFESSEKSVIYKLLVDLLFEYRSVEMLQAIRTLWDFFKQNDDNEKKLIKAYAKIKEDEENEIFELPQELRMEREPDVFRIHGTRQRIRELDIHFLSYDIRMNNFSFPQVTQESIQGS